MGLTPEYRLAMGISLTPKKYGLMCSGMREVLQTSWEQKAKRAFTASSARTLIKSIFHPSESAAFFQSVLWITNLKDSSVKGEVVTGGGKGPGGGSSSGPSGWRLLRIS